MRIVLTVPEEILLEACDRIVAFCKEHIISGEKLKDIGTNVVTVANEPEVICGLSRAA